VIDRLTELIRLACRAEVLARKPGNVHPGASFDDLSASDFLQAADIVAPILAQTSRLGVGRAVYEAVVATRQRVETNANLGICLLLAPLAACGQGGFPSELPTILSGLTVDDAHWAYAAIRAARPGGIAVATEQDVRDEPTVTLMEAMQLAADRDDVARQYATCYRDVFEVGLPAIEQFSNVEIEWGIVNAHLRLMAHRADTLIARKCGPVIAAESAQRAATVLSTGWPHGGHDELVRLDEWLRADGHRRNPGTTADLVAASVFVALRQGILAAEVLCAWCDDQSLGVGGGSNTQASARREADSSVQRESR
jgi:triphosphoribosyl-dephospho-CoA synthase